MKSLAVLKSIVPSTGRTLAVLEHRLHPVVQRLAGNARLLASRAGVVLTAAARDIPRWTAAFWERHRLLPRPIRVAIWLTVAALFVVWEFQTSNVQARILSALASKLTYTVELGSSPAIVFPKQGPWDERRGYTRVVEFSRRLERQGYRVVSQARFSKPLAFIARTGVTPPQPERPNAGLVICGAGGDTLYDAVRGTPDYRSFREIPPVVVQSLLFIENRELGRDTSGTANPAVDWNRFFKAAALYVGRHVGLPLPTEGGSTLAVQLEKYRHSPGGRTESGSEKLRQMLTASIRAYQRGPNTGAARRQIILDYVNSVPLGAARGYGEVFGLQEGLDVWFGMKPRWVRQALADDARPARRARALKAVLSLLCAVRAPTYYLTRRPEALEARVASYTRLLVKQGTLDEKTAEKILAAKVRPRQRSANAWENSVRIDQGTGRVREELRELLGVRDNYALDRLDVTVESTLEPGLQREVSALFRGLGKEDSVEARGLVGDRLLGGGDPSLVLYSLLVCERTPQGNVVRVEEDNLRGPLDLNRGTMLELGSTAKLRTLVHYLDLVTKERERLLALSPVDVATKAEEARDPISRWVAEEMVLDPEAPLDSLLERAMSRTYSANPGEVFFTGGGLTSFVNFDSTDNHGTFTVREAVVKSINLPFIRLMRDLVAYHAARLPYDASGVLSGDAERDRDRLLREIAKSEGELPDTSWLLKTDRKRAQDLRLRARIERDAFARMTEEWRRVGFPFAHLVPSYATAIGSSADQPGALADLMAVLVNDGRQRPTSRIRRVTFAPGTAYETTYAAPPDAGDRPLLDPAVARAARGVLTEVVDRGTAQKMRGAFDSEDMSVEIGGKTGTGDNRVEHYARGGQVISSEVVSRTATFVFYIQDRYYGVITASVLGPEASYYRFTSALPVTILRQLAPSIEKRLGINAPVASTQASAPGDTSSAVGGAL